MNHALQTFNGTHWKTLPTKFEPFPKHSYKRAKIVFIPEDDTKVYFVGGTFLRLSVSEFKHTDKIWEYDLINDVLKELSHRIPIISSKTRAGIVNHAAVGVRLDGNERVSKYMKSFKISAFLLLKLQ